MCLIILQKGPSLLIQYNILPKLIKDDALNLLSKLATECKEELEPYFDDIVQHMVLRFQTYGALVAGPTAMSIGLLVCKHSHVQTLIDTGLVPRMILVCR
jgi:tRNA isopentenyl-2-thiomethyl-A-37 hydroxylase MiaE